MFCSCTFCHRPYLVCGGLDHPRARYDDISHLSRECLRHVDASHTSLVVGTLRRVRTLCNSTASCRSELPSPRRGRTPLLSRFACLRSCLQARPFIFFLPRIFRVQSWVALAARWTRCCCVYVLSRPLEFGPERLSCTRPPFSLWSP